MLSAALLGLAAIAMALSLVVTPLVIGLCRRHSALDQPDARKIHKAGTPRLGGVAVFVALSLGLSAAAVAGYVGWLDLPVAQAQLLPVIYFGLCGFFLIGFLDDLKSIPVLPRLAGQVAVAAAVVLLSGGAIGIRALFGHYVLPEWLSVAVTVLWIAGVVNTFNWIDGLDGLAAGIAAISASAFLVLALAEQGLPNSILTAAICIVLIGAVLGFLPYNFFPARIFIGDGGAFSLGYLLAVVSVIGLFKQAAVVSFLLPVAILVLPLTDTLFAIVRRLVRGRPVTAPDNRHIHHRMLWRLSRTYRSHLPEAQASAVEEELIHGRAHRNSVLALYAFGAVFAGLAIILGLNS
jgi:UDP-GlcNAc:undecaprenyl-phosphate GlcNAc-1-phosphate transferase